MRENPGFSRNAVFRNSPSIRQLVSWAAKRKRSILYSVGTVLALFAVLSPTLFYRPPTATLQVGGRTLSLDIAANEARREKGLGGRAGMAADKGMLFVLDTPAKECFWMKDMRFSLDMVWLDSAKRVVYVQPDVSPRSYPKSFCPTAPAKYVIELNAGQASRLGLHTGQMLKF